MCLNSEGFSVIRFHGIDQWWQVTTVDADILLASSGFRFGMEVGAKMALICCAMFGVQMQLRLNVVWYGKYLLEFWATYIYHMGCEKSAACFIGC